jgi:H+/gluconate symporter-like permease
MAQTSNINGGWIIMKSMLMAIMAVAVAVTFSAPAFAGEEKDKKDEKKGGHVLVYGEEKKDEKKKDGKFTDTFGEEKKKDEKGGK